MRDCHIGLKIGNANEINLVDNDFHLLESPDMVVAPVRDYDIQEYPESAEAEMDCRTTLKPFEYKIQLGYWGDDDTANQKIKALYDSMFATSESNDIKTALPVQLFNYWKGVKMTGYAKAWDEKTYTIQGEDALVCFYLTIYVKDPRTFLPI